MKTKTLLLSSFAGLIAGIFYMVSVKYAIDNGEKNASSPQNQVQRETAPDNDISVLKTQTVHLF